MTGCAQPLSAQGAGYDRRREKVIEFGGLVGVREDESTTRFFGNGAIGGPHRTTFDPVGGRVFAVAHGGGSMWIWSGGAWRTWNGTVPAAAGSVCHTWDETRNRLVSMETYWTAPAQLWEWDGTAFVGPFAGPVAGFGVGNLQYDGVTKKVMALGRSAFGGPIETWLWDGRRWRRAFTGEGPSGTSFGSFAYDPERNRLVCIGSHTWEWDGRSWALVAQDCPGPVWPGLVYDQAKRRLLRVDGNDVHGDMAWDGVRWTQVGPARAPVPWSQGIVPAAFDVAHDRVVTFDGVGGGETWTWDGVDPRQQTPRTQPPGRHRHTLAYHAPSQRVVMFGGVDSRHTTLGDTWLWDGVDWAPVVGPGPSPRSAAAMTGESWGTCLLFGGADPAGNLLGDTWTWTGTTWASMPVAGSPPARRGALLAHDAARQRTVLISSNEVVPRLLDTWEWNGAAWSLANTGSAPWADRMCYYPEAGGVVSNGYEIKIWNGSAWVTPSTQPGLCGGGQGYDPLRHLPFTHRGGYSAAFFVEYPACYRPYVACQTDGCGGAAGPPDLTTVGSPVPNERHFRFEVVWRPRAPVAVGLALGCGSQPLGHGCEWMLTGPVYWLAGATDAKGLARWPFALAHNPALASLEVDAQAVTLDASAPPGFALSNNIRLGIGP